MELTPSIPAMFLFYLLLIENYINELVPCGLQRLLTCNMIAKHIVGFLALTFSVVITLYSSNNVESMEYILYQSFVLYLLFLMSSRLPQNMSVLFLFVCCIIYLLYMFKTTSNYNKLDTKHQERIKKAISSMTIILYFIIGGGFVYYYFKKRKTYGKKFRHFHFLFGRTKCKSLKTCS